MTYLYLIEQTTPDDTFTKPGVSNDPETRLTKLQTANPYALRLVAQYDTPNRASALRVENLLKYRFKRQHVRGEWYNIPALRIVRFLDVCIEVAQIISHVEVTREERIKRLLVEPNMDDSPTLQAAVYALQNHSEYLSRSDSYLANHVEIAVNDNLQTVSRRTWHRAKKVVLDK